MHEVKERTKIKDKRRKNKKRSRTIARDAWVGVNHRIIGGWRRLISRRMDGSCASCPCNFHTRQDHLRRIRTWPPPSRPISTTPSTSSWIRGIRVLSFASASPSTVHLQLSHFRSTDFCFRLSTNSNCKVTSVLINLSLFSTSCLHNLKTNFTFCSRQTRREIRVLPPLFFRR